MARSKLTILCLATALIIAGGSARADQSVLPDDAVVVDITAAKTPPSWALKQRLLLEENVRAAGEYYRKYWDERGHLLCIPRWGWADGADDVLQGVANFPLLYALGGDREVLDLYYRAFEGFLEQFTTGEVEYEPEYGAVHDEFLTANDWHHHGEHLAAFNQLPLAEPDNDPYRERALRFAGFYLNEGLPENAEPIYDPKHRIIRSIINGSLGARLEIEPTFWGHKWEEWADRTRVKGDGPLNLYATTLPANAFVLSGQERYRRWVLQYVDAWVQRTRNNDDIIPANVGLSGKVGEHWDGRWWPQTLGAWSHRDKRGSDGLSLFLPGVVSGLQNAMILSGDTSYMGMLRRQIHVLLENAIEHEDGKKYPPRVYEDDGWGGRMRFGRHLVRLYLSEFRREDLQLIEEEIQLWGTPGRFSYNTGYFYHVDDFAWLYYVLGENPEFPENMMRSDLNRIRRRMQAVRRDDSAPRKRETHHTHRYNPVATHALFNTITGGVGPLLAKGTSMIRTELWHFDPEAARPGLPPEVGALVDSVAKGTVAVNLVNLNQTEPRTVVIQTGAYGENQCISIHHRGREIEVDSHYFAVRLEPGSGDRLVLKLDRLANTPAAGLPWNKQPRPHD